MNEKRPGDLLFQYAEALYNETRKQARRAERRDEADLELEPLRISAQEVMQLLEAGETVFFVDARPPQFWRAADSKILDAVHIPPGDVESRLEEIPLQHLIVTYCTLPEEAASAEVARRLLEHNRENTRALKGGFGAWRHSGYPVTEKYKEGGNG